MKYLLDSSILFRIANVLDPRHALAQQALVKLRAQHIRVLITPQNLIEFRNGATRPAEAKGLGLSAETAAQEAAKFEAAFEMAEDTPGIYPAWKMLADAAGVMGKQVHDTRLVAVCHVHGISHLLTFNPKDFLRFQGVGPGLTVVDPNTV